MNHPLTSWITGLMRENAESVGFIPNSTVAGRYLRTHRFVLQHDEAGRRVGYLLHGALRYGRPATVAQHCIQFDRRRKGYGESALQVLVDRATQVGASGIYARVATDLEALPFWVAEGFHLLQVVPGGQKRDRKIARLWLPLALPLFDSATAISPLPTQSHEISGESARIRAGHGLRAPIGVLEGPR